MRHKTLVKGAKWVTLISKEQCEILPYDSIFAHHINQKCICSPHQLCISASLTLCSTRLNNGNHKFYNSCKLMIFFHSVGKGCVDDPPTFNGPLISCISITHGNSKVFHLNFNWFVTRYILNPLAYGCFKVIGREPSFQLISLILFNSIYTSISLLI